jgi:5-methylcytosine-specific restriction endonuclease McrA
MSDVLVLNASGEPLSQIPLSVIPWQVAMRLLFLDKVKVLKTYDDWVVRSQYLNMNVPSIVMMTEQVKWRRNVRYNRNNVFLRDDFTCQLQITNQCKETKGKVKFTELTIDHVEPKSHGGTSVWANVCTSCKSCNSQKGSDRNITPKKKPYKPTYYDMLAKRKTMPLHIRDEGWKFYLDWPEELIKISP